MGLTVTNIQHKDKIGQILKPGDTVAYVRWNSINVGYIRNLTPKRVQVLPYGENSFSTSSPQQPNRILKIEPSPALTAWFLRQK